MYKKVVSAVMALVMVAGTGAYSPAAQSRAISLDDYLSGVLDEYPGGMIIKEYEDHVVITGYTEYMELPLYGLCVIPEEIHGLPVTEIADCAFVGCTQMRSVKIPDTVEKIGRLAFGYCTNLKEVELSNSISILEEGTFDHCESLTEITIPGNVSKIESGVFWDCSDLKKIAISNPKCELAEDFITNNGKYTGVIAGDEGSTAEAFAEKCGCWFELLTNAYTIEYQGMFKYRNYSNYAVLVKCDTSKVDPHMLSRITVPEKLGDCTVLEIDDLAFAGCNTTKIIDLPDTVTRIGNSAFENCTELTTINMPEDLLIVEDGAFRNCKSLTEITFQKGIYYLCSGAFYNCPSLTSITILDSNCVISDRLFKSGDASMDFTGVIHGYFDSTAETFAEKNGYDFEPMYDQSRIDSYFYLDYYKADDHVTILSCEYKRVDPHMLTGIVIPDEFDGLPVTRIGKEAFLWNPYTSIIKLPETIEKIDARAFACAEKLTEINIPNSVASIGEYAFAGCFELTEVTLPDSISEIKDYTFMNCSSLTEIVIPENVSSIGAGAFEECVGLKSMTILDPECVIDDFCFKTENYLGDYSGVIYGYNNSTAQIFAKKHGYEFVALDGAPENSKLNLGDVNCDGVITIADATTILQYLGNSEKYPLSYWGKMNADVVSPEGITPSDSIAIQRYAVGLIENFSE